MRSILVTVQILLICFVVASAKKSRLVSQPTVNVVCSASFWKPASKVDVFFIRDLFTTDQRRAVLDTMHYSEAAAQKVGAAVTFNDAGETDGLIDCENCLTIARQGDALDRKGRIVFNSLRRNDRGNLVSAWIAFGPRDKQSRKVKRIDAGGSARRSRGESIIRLPALGTISIRH